MSLSGTGWILEAIIFVILIGCVLIIARRKLLEKADQLHRSEERYSALFLENPDVVISFDLDGRITSANHAAERLLGVGKSDLTERNLGSFAVEDETDFVRDNFAVACKGESTSFETSITVSDGRRIDLSVVYLPITTGGEVTGVYAVAKDVTPHRELENRLIHQTLHDDLTGLPNRTLFADRISQAMLRAERAAYEDEDSGNQVAILFIDLDNFKIVNDSLGHEAGDRLIIEAARRISASLRSVDTAARLGGDEFAVVLEGLDGPESVTRPTRKILEELSRPFVISGQNIVVGASIGIAIADPNSRDVGELIRRADIAMYRAKQNGKSGYRVFDLEMDSAARMRLSVESDLRRAMARNEFVLRYQPKFRLTRTQDSTRNGIVGFEALIRWQHPERGMIAPGEFIPIAEDTDLIVPVGSWVLREACRTAKSWHDLLLKNCPASEGIPELVMCVNLSSRQLKWEGIVRDVRGALEESGLPPSCLNLEITEGVLMEDFETAGRVFDSLRNLGVKLSIDDFGTGYSSLSYLRRFPVDYLKVDRSFIRDIDNGIQDEAIVDGIVHLARSLGLEVIAEGVETDSQLRKLREIGCDFVQGFLFSPPVTDFEAIRALMQSLPKDQTGQPSSRQPISQNIHS